MDISYRPPTLGELTFSPSTESALRSDPQLGRKLAGLARDLHTLRLDNREKQAAFLDYYAGNDRTHYKLGTSSWMAASRKLLEDSKTPAGVLLVAAKNVLGPAINTFEPDTIRMELEHEGVNVPAVNFDKLLASITLLDTPMFYMEVLTFSNTVLAFNDEPLDTEILHEASPAQIAWGVYEAEIMLHEHMMFEPIFDEEPRLYTAASLHRAGMILAPPLLKYAQEALDKLNKDSELKPETVRSAWEALPKGESLTNRTFSEDPVDIQLAKLASVQVYVSERAEAYREAMRALTNPTP